MARTDSVDKIVESYFQVVTREDFTYRGKEYKAKALQVSPTLLRGFTCPEACGACCTRFSLDYLPSEKRPKGTKKRTVLFNDQEIILHSNLQEDHNMRECGMLSWTGSGRCTIHGKHPFTCDFELIRTSVFSSPNRPNILGQRLYGRGWNMLRVDGERGALCTMTKPTPDSIKEVIRKLNRLKKWTDHFGINTWIPQIKYCISQGYLREGKPITFDNSKVKGLF
jgi:hypothetical protein